MRMNIMDNDIITFVNKFSNDQELGAAVRKYVAEHLKHELDMEEVFNSHIKLMESKRCKYCGGDYNAATIGDRCEECLLY